MKRRALVTGASGFVGRHVADRLEKDGWHVFRAVRRMPSGGAASTLVLGLDRWDKATLSIALKEAQPDIVFHMAGLTWASAAAPFYEANATLGAHLLDAIWESDARPAVIFAGSAAEYGYVPENRQPVDEEACCNPVTHNGISKYAQTSLALTYARAGLQVLIARIFNPVGVGMPPKLALASFAAQLRSGAETLRVGNLDVARDFIEIAEAARVIVAVASDAANYGRIFNICSGVALQLRPLVDEMIKLTGRRVQLAMMPELMRTGEMVRFYGSVARLNAVGIAVRKPDFRQILPDLLGA